MQKSLTIKQQFWFNHVIAAESCSLPLSAYAAQHNLSAKSLYNWRWKFTQQNNSDMKKENPFIKIIPSIKPIPKIISVALFSMFWSQSHRNSSCIMFLTSTQSFQLLIMVVIDNFNAPLLPQVKKIHAIIVAQD